MAWMFQWNIHMSCTHVPTHVAKRQASTVWLLCGLAAVVLVVWWWRSCFCSGSRRRISWRRLGVLVWETRQSAAALPRSITALTGGDNCWRGAPEFPLKLSRAPPHVQVPAQAKSGAPFFCLVVVCALAPFFSSSHMRLEERKKNKNTTIKQDRFWMMKGGQKQ